MGPLELIWTKAAIEATADMPGLAKKANVKGLVLE